MVPARQTVHLKMIPYTKTVDILLIVLENRQKHENLTLTNAIKVRLRSDENCQTAVIPYIEFS